MNYSLVWCRSSWRSGLGFRVHAAADDKEGGYPNKKTLCGVSWDRSDWGTVGEHGEPGCSKCRKTLRRLGVLDEEE